MDWFYYDLILLIKSWETLYKNLDKALLLSRNQVFCMKNWKLWQAPKTIEFSIFCWNFAHISYLLMSTYHCVRDFFISFRSWIICKSKKMPGFYTFVFYIFINNSRSKQNKKKSRVSFCRHYQVGNVCKISAKNIKLCGSWSSSKARIFQTNSLVSRK